MKVKNSVVRASGIPGYCAVGASGAETAFYATKVAIFIKTTECFALKLRRFAKKLRALLSTGKCKIIDLSEENILGSVKI